MLPCKDGFPIKIDLSLDNELYLNNNTSILHLISVPSRGSLALVFAEGCKLETCGRVWGNPHPRGGIKGRGSRGLQCFLELLHLEWMDVTDLKAQNFSG